MYGLDLFSGIGGITKALDGYVTPVAYCENDRYAQGVLLSRMGTGDLPYAPVWDDVRTLKSEMLPDIDIIYGGFPCQDISVAGRGAGLEGKRSGLFFEIARLVSELRPRFIFLENVPAIARRGGDAVVGTLAHLGYDCRWDVLSAADVGANHLRERWWLLAHAKHEGRNDRWRVEGRRDDNENGWPTSKGSDGNIGRLCADFSSGGQDVVAHANQQGLQRRDSGELQERTSERIVGTGGSRKMGDTASEGLPNWTGGTMGQPRPITEFERPGGREIERDFRGVAYGVQNRVDRLRALGNSVVPAQAREAFERLLGLE